jgi:hypothetical protein
MALGFLILGAAVWSRYGAEADVCSQGDFSTVVEGSDVTSAQHIKGL